MLRAYEEAQIYLIDRGNLPVVDLVTLKQAYPHFARLLDRQNLRKKLGIAEGDAWPVVLVGYLMHSLSRTRSEIMAGPYVAEKGDEFSDGITPDAAQRPDRRRRTGTYPLPSLASGLSSLVTTGAA